MIGMTRREAVFVCSALACMMRWLKSLLKRGDEFLPKSRDNNGGGRDLRLRRNKGFWNKALGPQKTPFPKPHRSRSFNFSVTRIRCRSRSFNRHLRAC